MMDRRRTKRLQQLPTLDKESNSLRKLTSHKHLLLLTNFVDPQIEAEITRIQNKTKRTVEDVVMLCLLRFRQMRAVMTRVPKTAAAWLNVQLQMVKRKIKPPIKYLSDKDIKKIIIHVRQINANRHPDVIIPEDPDLPSCYYWSVEQVGQWISSIGYEHLKDMFVNNFVSGRKLITIDASALSKMGLKYFKDIQVIAAKIREIIKIPKPNFMRDLMCKVPFEQYLKQRQWSGESYDRTTFEKFCETHGYPYRYLMKNPMAVIDCTRQLTDYMSAFSDLKFDLDGIERSSTVMESPSVEFTVRHILVRDKIVSALINELLEMGLKLRESQAPLKKVNSLGDIFNAGFAELGISPEDVAKRLEFGRLIADEMLSEAMRTSMILRDMAKFKRFLKDANLSDETVQEIRDAAQEFFGSASNIATLLALGELDLEVIFRQQPEFNAFVDGIIEEAEQKVNDVVPDAEAFIDEIIREAESRVEKIEFEHLEPRMSAFVRGRARSLLNEMFESRILNVQEVKRRREDTQELIAQRRSEFVVRTSPRMSSIIPTLRTHSRIPSPTSGSHVVSPRSSTIVIGDIPDTTIAYATVQTDQLDDNLSRKLGGAELDTSGEKASLQVVETSVTASGDTNQTITITLGSETPKTEQLTDSVDTETEPEHAGQVSPTSEPIDPELTAFVLDHIVYEVVEEALTQALAEPVSAAETKQLTTTLQELREAAGRSEEDER